jgi:hypothetical protein
VHASAEDKYDHTKNIFYEDLLHVFDQFPKQYVNILFDFIAKVGREDILNMTSGIESLQSPSQMNGDKMYNLRFDAENFKDQKGKI